MSDETLVARLRRMVAEPTTAVYSNEALLDEYIKQYPVPDASKNKPTEADWVPTYDLHAAAADIWEEKAAAIAHRFSYAADGGNYQEDQRYQHCLSQAKHHMARRRAQNRRLTKKVGPSA